MGRPSLLLPNICWAPLLFLFGLDIGREAGMHELFRITRYRQVCVCVCVCVSRLSDAFLFLIRSENADHLDWF
jgi:hypothetical protein